jgi:RNA polymerase sigma-70 factor, ECF subfamily
MSPPIATAALPTRRPGIREAPVDATSPGVLAPDLLGAHFDPLYRAAWAMCGSREDAEDLVQTTFARVLARPRLIRRGSERGYLLRVLRNTFVSARRASASRPDVSGGDPEALELPSSRAEPEAAAEAHEVFAAIAGLPGGYRDALVAIDVLGLSYREAAAALHVRQATVTTRLFRARNRVAKALSGE